MHASRKRVGEAPREIARAEEKTRVLSSGFLVYNTAVMRGFRSLTNQVIKGA